MRTRLLCSALLGLGMALCAVASAQAPTKTKPPAAPGKKPPEATPAAKPKDKIREGAYLRKDLPLDRKVDLRGVYEKARDAELIVHYQRLAELDWIEQLATKSADNRLLERVETVRRKEAKRFSEAMARLWEQARARELVGFP